MKPCSRPQIGRISERQLEMRHGSVATARSRGGAYCEDSNFNADAYNSMPGRMSELGPVSRVTPVHTAMRNCTRDKWVEPAKQRNNASILEPLSLALIEKGLRDWVIAGQCS